MQASPHPDTWEGSSGITEIEGSDEAMAGREFLTKLDDAEDRIRKRVQITEEYLKETHSEEVRFYLSNLLVNNCFLVG